MAPTTVKTRRLLQRLLDECRKCHEYYDENVAIIADDNGELNEEQMQEVFVRLHDLHRDYHDDVS